MIHALMTSILMLVPMMASSYCTRFALAGYFERGDCAEAHSISLGAQFQSWAWNGEFFVRDQRMVSLHRDAMALADKFKCEAERHEQCAYMLGMIAMSGSVFYVASLVH